MSFDAALHLVTTYGYILVFLLMIVEGPITTIVSSFAAALGIFDVYTVLILAVVGNIIPDLIYYSIGFWGRKSVIDKYQNFFGFKKKHIDKLEKISAENVVKSLIIVKLVPFFAMPGLITAGALKIKFKKYLLWISIITFFNSLIYLLIGYNFGSAYKAFEGYFDFKLYLVAILIIVFLAIIYVYRKIMNKVIRLVE